MSGDKFDFVKENGDVALAVGKLNDLGDSCAYELISIKAALRTPEGEDPVLHAKAVRELADATIKLAGQ